MARRGLRYWGLALLLILSVALLAFPALPVDVAHREATSAPPLGTSALTASMVQASTATTSGKANRNFWQNGTALYQTGSSLLSVSSNLAGYAPTAVISSTMTLTVGMPNGMTPMVNVTQGSSYLVNATVPYSASFGTRVSATPVHISIVAAFTSTGTTPANAKYAVWYNWTQTVVFSNASVPRWILQNGSTENLSAPLTVPTGYALTQTSITLPYPFQAFPNVSTINITTAVGYRFVGPFTNLTTFTSQPGLGYLTAYLATVSSNETLRVKFLVLGLTTGKIPLLIIGPLTLLSVGLYTTTAAYVNTGALPYAGFYYIQLNRTISYAVNPQSLNVTANTRFLHNSTFSVAGSQIIVLPGAWTTYGGRSTVFTLKFSLLNAPPSFRLCLTCSAGNTAVPWWVLTAGVEAILVGAALSVFSRARTRKIILGGYTQRQDAGSIEFYVLVVGIAFVALLVVAAVVTGGV